MNKDKDFEDGFVVDKADRMVFLDFGQFQDMNEPLLYLVKPLL